jgi:hypothetical protein
MNRIRWRKSNVSGYQDCVEMGHTLRVIRDSKNPTGPTLTADVVGLLAAIRRGDLVGS